MKALNAILDALAFVVGYLVLFAWIGVAIIVYPFALAFDHFRRHPF